MSELTSYAALAFASLFTAINPIGAASVFATLTGGMTPAHVRRTAVRATAFALAILLFFTIAGRTLFAFFSITVDDLRVVGGVIFFAMGYEMLNGRVGRIKEDDEGEHDYASDIAITPLAIPVLCGPGAITSAIIFASEATEPAQAVVLGAVIAVVMAITLVGLLGSERIMRFLGLDGRRVLLRLMGLIVMAIAVEFLVAGLGPIVRGILAGA